MDNSVSIVLLVLLLVHSSKPAISEKVDSYSCKSPQLLELGKIGSVQCLFTNNFNGVHWFNSTNLVDDIPVISLHGSRKYGSGYLTREYDIRNDGSLIIHNVSLLHELTFAVAVLTPPDDTLIAIEVQVQVIVKPAVLFPVISTCSREERICFAKLHLINSFTCTMGNSRPPVSLTLKVRTLYGDRSIAGPYENKTMIAFSPQDIDTDDIWISSSLVLLVCQVESNPFNNMLKHQTSLLLLENNAVYLKDSPIVTEVFNKDGNLLLECDYYEGGVIVWERSSSAEGIYKTILYGSTGIEEFRIFLANDSISESNGSLAVSSANFLHEGFYRCISSNIIYETSRLYEAICIVPPSPPYPVIEGCNGTHIGCVLYFDDNHGIVECSIHRIYPKVDLAISLTSEAHSDIITFYDKEGKITEHEETYTVTLKYAVSVETTSTDQLTLQCTIHDPPYEQLNLTTSFEIDISQAVKRSEVDDFKKEDSRRKLALLCLLIMLPITVVIGCVAKRKRVCNRTSPQDTKTGEERVPLSVVTQPRDDEVLTLKDKFMQQIRETYAGFYNAVKPLPYQPTVMVNVNDIFVEGRIQLLTSQRRWKDLQSYAHILTDKRIEKRCLIEGPPGSGKSTLSLQFAYEWSQGKLNERADIVLLFQLRKMKQISTLQQAIKELLLPQDSRIKENEIEEFFNEFNSVVIIFDAYDEMPDQTGNNFIANILNNSSHREFKVIVTTRSSCLPEEYSPRTSRIYLDGFNDKDRDTYIKKVFKDEEDVVKIQIQKQLETTEREDLFFRDIFKCPFFFVVVVHNWKENKGRYHRSVTYTVNLLLSSLVLHMNNKHYSTTITEIPYSDDLNQVVFNSIIQNKRELWTVEEFKQFDGNLHSVYKQLGILEDIAPRSSYYDEQPLDETDIGDSFVDIVNVAIRRKFIREWFAAKYIVKNIVSLTNKDLITFSKSLAEKAQEGQFYNIFRFACGIDVVAAAKILYIILKSKDNQKLAVSCIMEIKSSAFTERIRSLKRICKHSIEIAIEDNLYTQRELRDFLELVADYRNLKFIIPSVILMNSYQSVDDSHENILLKSDLNIPSSIPTKELCIVKSEAEFTSEEIKQLIEYAYNVKLLKTVSLERCLVPFQLEEVTATYSNLHRTIDVIWRPEDRSKRFPWYRLNSVGHWEDSTHAEITDQDYKRVADTIKEITDTSHTHLG